MNKCVFFDRDGVVNRDFGYVYKESDFKFIDGIFDLLALCKDRGYLAILITNQSGIGRGYYMDSDFMNITNYMQDQLLKNSNCKFDAIYYCPHREEDNCECRKPKIKNFLKAVREFNIDIKKSIMIGDSATDMKAAQNMGLNRKIYYCDNSLNYKKMYETNTMYMPDAPFSLPRLNLKYNLEVIEEVEIANNMLDIISDFENTL